MKHLYISVCMALLVLGQAMAQEKPEPKAEPTSPDIVRLEVRVIFADETGIFGSLPQELKDMRGELSDKFDYPRYTLVNTIHLNLFTDDEATALVFPEHFLRLIPKGSAKSGGYKLKAELYNAPNERALRTRIYTDSSNERIEEPLGVDLPAASIEENVVEGEHSKVFPIVSSAVLAEQEAWRSFGGIQIYATSQHEVRSSRMSSSSLGSSLQPQTQGDRKYLILAVRLKGVE